MTLPQPRSRSAGRDGRRRERRPDRLPLLPLLAACLLLAASAATHAQVPMRGMPRMPGMSGGGRASGGGAGGDSLRFEKRDFSQDSVTVIFRYLDTARFNTLDTSISDFFARVPMKPEYVSLGNNGNAVRPLLFSPSAKTGWDAGFHAFDPYAFRLRDARFANTTKPYTELAYLIGMKLEQQVGIFHTQNIRPNWNFVVHYRLVTAPGAYNSQNTNHAAVRFNTHYTSPNQRYNAFLVALSNANQSSENGGIESDTFLVNRNQAYTRDRFNIPTRMADSVFSTRNFFSVKLLTGNRYTEGAFLLRQQYDFGKKDSLVTDSSVTRFFLPRLRVEHTVEFARQSFRFLDVQAGADSLYYKQRYGISGLVDTLSRTDRWRRVYNDISLVQFPDPRNPLQFFKAGAALETLQGEFGTRAERLSDLHVHGEYRNRTRNRKWDMLLHGRFHVVGRYAGDYLAEARIRSQLGSRIGFLELGFRNVNRTPSANLGGLTSFPFRFPAALARENATSLSASLELPPIRTRLTAEYFLVGNYTYLRDFNRVEQAATLFNLLRLGVNRAFRVGRHWRWHLDLHAQLTTQQAPVNVPLLYTRNRFAYEGRFFRNLNLATGIDLRYMTPYRADDYSPVLGAYFLQDDAVIAMLPDAAAYLNFRIRNFSTFVRLENLNTFSLRYGFGFKNANFSAPSYPTQDLHFRLGVFWGFVN